ncbi:hypothetical protein ACOME3_005538 [Neoechinorhynchus agilis]
MRVTLVNRGALIDRFRSYFRKSPESSPPVVFRRPVLAKFDDRQVNGVLDPWDTLHGMARLDVALRLRGIANPMRPIQIKRKAISTREDPNVVTSFHDESVLGCVCEEEQCHVKYMKIYRGETKRCYCAHWFRLDEAHLPDLSEFGIDSQAVEEYFKEN